MDDKFCTVKVIQLYTSTYAGTPFMRGHLIPKIVLRDQRLQLSGETAGEDSLKAMSLQLVRGAQRSQRTAS